MKCAVEYATDFFFFLHANLLDLYITRNAFQQFILTYVAANVNPSRASGRDEERATDVW